MFSTELMKREFGGSGDRHCLILCRSTLAAMQSKERRLVQSHHTSDHAATWLWMCCHGNRLPLTQWWAALCVSIMVFERMYVWVHRLLLACVREKNTDRKWEWQRWMDRRAGRRVWKWHCSHLIRLSCNCWGSCLPLKLLLFFSHLQLGIWIQ